VTEQPDNSSGEGAPAWVPSDPEKAEPAAGGEPTAVQPPVDPTTQVTAPEPEAPVAAEPVAQTPPPPVTPDIQTDGARTSAPPDDRPEIAIGAAFAGGFAVAMILKRLAR
jgi:hypothetical protein